MAVELHIIVWGSEALQPTDEIAISAPLAPWALPFQDGFGFGRGQLLPTYF
jgi:hypothetical protein